MKVVSYKEATFFVIFYLVLNTFLLIFANKSETATWRIKLFGMGRCLFDITSFLSLLSMLFQGFFCKCNLNKITKQGYDFAKS